MRFIAMALVTLAISTGAVGCKKVDPRTTQAWDRACHAQDSVMFHNDANDYNTRIVAWINDHAHDDNVKTTFAKAQTLSTPAEKAKLVRGAASDSGVNDCPVVDVMWPATK